MHEPCWAAAAEVGRTGPGPSSSGRTPNRRRSRRRQRLTRCARSTCAPRARHPRGQAVERVRRPPSLSRPHDPGGAQATPSTTATARPSPCSSTAAWKLAPRDNFIGWTPQLREKNLPLVVDNQVPHPADRAAIVRRRLPVTGPSDADRDQTPRYTGAVYGPPAGSMSEPPGDADAMIGKGRTSERTSGSDRSEKTGNESSTGDTLPAVTGRPNAYR